MVRIVNITSVAKFSALKGFVLIWQNYLDAIFLRKEKKKRCRKGEEAKFGEYHSIPNFLFSNVKPSFFLQTISLFYAPPPPPPASLDRAHMVFGPSVRPFVRLFVLKNFYIGHIL